MFMAKYTSESTTIAQAMRDRSIRPRRVWPIAEGMSYSGTEGVEEPIGQIRYLNALVGKARSRGPHVEGQREPVPPPAGNAVIVGT